MPLRVYRLRRILAATAVLLTALVAGMYFYARSRATNVLKSIPKKIGYDIKQTAHGFQFSKSDGQRTLFTVEASDLKQFKLDGNAELHNVNIVVYGRDSSRYDQISGDDFAYNQGTGDVTAMGDVSIDLVANPAGLTSPDQSAPKELKNPIHLKTRNLIFNKNTGNAWTDARVEFRTPQASGSAVGINYEGKSNQLILSSQIHLEVTGPHAAVIEAKHGVITNEPRLIVLDQPRLTRESGNVQAVQATFHLGRENHVENIVATGDVRMEARTVPRKASTKAAAHKGAVTKERTDQETPTEMRGRSDRAEFLFSPGEDLLRTANLSRQVHFEETGSRPMQGEAGRVILDFAGQNELQKVHALENVHLIQKQSEAIASSNTASGSQDFDLNASAIDFKVTEGRFLQQAVTSGAAQITIAQPSGAKSPPATQRTVVTAGKFTADFARSDGATHLATIHGAPDARIVSSTPGQPDRISTSDSVEATFLPQGGIETITQTGQFTYADNLGPDKRMQAWADSARYTPANQMLLLIGSPRVANGGMATTANTIRINRANGDALADGDVKSTYSDVKENPNGALLASSSPIHVTAQTMTAHNAPPVALYKGNVRLWQDANVIEAPSIQFDRDHRNVTALGTPAQPVQTILVQSEKVQSEKPPPPAADKSRRSAKAGSAPSGTSPITITAAKVTYVDSERKVHYEGDVLAKATEFTASAKTADAYLLPHSQSSIQPLSTPGQLDRMVAEGNVLIQQPKRRAEGQKLVYTAAEDKFVLTGGPPSIFDAEQGKITGVSLTFFRHDDRVLVEGEASSPVVTQTRIAR